MSRYKAYPGYKESGIPWLGQVPTHWLVSKVKHVAAFQVGWTPPTKDDQNFEGENLWANISDLKGREISETSKRVSDSAVKAASMQITPKGSLLYSFKLSVGAVSFAGLDMYTNEAIASFLKESDLPLAYLYYVLPKYLIENASTNIYGARILNQELICNANLIVPTFDEATNIANFLDHEAAKIDALIEKQQRLIELLKEKRQTVISHAVTKGLNPNAPMKDSGVEWLGDIPFDWECVRLKFASELSGGKVAPSNEERYVGLENVQSNSGKFIATEEVIPEGISNVFSRGDVLFGKLRPYLAKSWLADFSGICSSEFLVMTSRKIDSKFLHYFTLTEEFIKQVDSSTYGSKMPRASWDYIGLLNIPIPSHESEKVAAFLDHETAKIDTLIEKQQRLIELAKERRTALISAAVTGKIDVRDWQAAA